MNIAMEQTEVGTAEDALLMHTRLVPQLTLREAAAGVCQRAAEKQIWGRLHTRQQWCALPSYDKLCSVHLCAKATALQLTCAAQCSTSAR